MEEAQTRLDSIAHTLLASLGQAAEALVWREKGGGREGQNVIIVCMFEIKYTYLVRSPLAKT